MPSNSTKVAGNYLYEVRVWLILPLPTLIDRSTASQTERKPSHSSGPKSVDPATDLARCFLRLANLPSYPLDRLSRYEAILWRRPARSCLLSMHWIVANHKIEAAVSGSVADKTCRPIDATIIEPPDPPIYAIDAELGRDGRAALSRKISEPLVARESNLVCLTSPSKPLDLMPAGLSLQYVWLPSEIAVTRSDCCSTFRCPGAAPVGLECSRCAVLRA